MFDYVTSERVRFKYIFLSSDKTLNGFGKSRVVSEKSGH